MRHALSAIKRFFTYNVLWKLFALAVASIAWVFVAREPELATSLSAPILFRNLPDDLDISSAVPDRIHLEIRGPANRLTNGGLSKTALVLDLNGVQPGERTFTINSWDIQDLPRQVAFYRAVPSQISLRFDRLVTRFIPVAPAYSKPPPAGYKIARFTIDPPQLKVRGPEDHVKAIGQLTTDPIDLSGAVSRATRRAHVRVGDPQVRIESSPVVRFTVDLQKDIPKALTKDSR